MSEMPFEGFTLPSQASATAGIGAKYPSLAQLSGRLLHILPTGITHNTTTPLKKDPHTRLTVDLTFFDGPPIDMVLNKSGQAVAPLTPPIQPGQTQPGRFLNQTWFVRRMEGRVNKPGYTGMIGRLTQIPGTSGNTIWALEDPTPAEIEKLNAWWAWKQANPGAGIYMPAPVEQSAAQPMAQPMAAPMPQQAPAPNPFAQPQAQSAPAPNPFAQPQAQSAPAPAVAQSAPNPFAQPAPAPAVTQPAAQQTPAASPFPWEV